MKIKTNPTLLWAKRLFIYVLGLYLTAMGVVFSARSALGVSPVSSLGNVLYQIGQKVRFNFRGNDIVLFSRRNGRLIAQGKLEVN